jgi:hypothetical protein
MPRYIEFVTPIDDETYELSFGNPVHDGRVPPASREVQGVRVDGEPIVLLDEALVGSLHRALVQMRGRLWAPYADCVSFAAVMNGLPMPPKRRNPLLNTRTDIHIDPDDTTVTDTLNLGKRYRDMPSYHYAHTVVPAHSPGVAQYVHKLGDKGPVCLTSLEDALSMYACTVAHPVILPQPQ